MVPALVVTSPSAIFSRSSWSSTDHARANSSSENKASIWPSPCFTVTWMTSPSSVVLFGSTCGLLGGVDDNRAGCRAILAEDGRRDAPSPKRLRWPGSPLLRLGADRRLDAAIGHQPQDRDAEIDGERDPRADESQRHRGDIGAEREPALPIRADRLREDGVATIDGDDRALEPVVTR